MPNPNTFAFFALIVWPLIAYTIAKKRDRVDSTVLLVVAPYLFLPVKTALELPLLPSIDKSILTGIVLFAYILPELKKQGFLPSEKLPALLLLMAFSGRFLTFFTNQDPLVYISATIPGMSIKDTISIYFELIFTFYVPFMAGYLALHSVYGYKRLVYWIALLGTIYIIPVLWEIRMSPQLHAQIYGFFPHSFAQQIRSGGFRPVVFLGHGILVAVYMFMATVCAYALWRNKQPIGKFNSKYIFLALVIATFLCKTLSAMIYLVIALGLLLITTPRKTAQVSLFIVLIVAIYPWVRDSVSPLLDEAVILVEQHSEERSKSLLFRLNNENELLEKAFEQQFFGWGSWARNFVYDKWGMTSTVIDGIWIIMFSTWGWFGYLGYFGIFLAAQWRLSGDIKRAKGNEAKEFCLYGAALGLVLTLNVLDTIPNSSANNITTLIAGALLGRDSNTNRGRRRTLTKQPRGATTDQNQKTA